MERVARLETEQDRLSQALEGPGTFGRVGAAMGPRRLEVRQPCRRQLSDSGTNALPAAASRQYDEAPLIAAVTANFRGDGARPALRTVDGVAWTPPWFKLGRCITPTNRCTIETPTLIGG